MTEQRLKKLQEEVKKLKAEKQAEIRAEINGIGRIKKEIMLLEKIRCFVKEEYKA